MVKGSRRVHRMRVGHYDTGCDFDCVGLFDFVMAHYADDIALMRLNLWDDTGGCSMVLFGLLAQWLERHSYKMCGPGSIPGQATVIENCYRYC